MSHYDKETTADSSNPEMISKLQGLFDDIHDQRDDILTAFIAKYGLEPNEIEQVVTMEDNFVVWSVRKKKRCESGGKAKVREICLEKSIVYVSKNQPETKFN